MREVRNILKKDENIIKYFYELYQDKFDIKFGNFGFIVVINGFDYVLKYYVSTDFLFKYDIYETLKFYLREKETYDLFNSNGFIVPSYDYLGEVIIGGNNFNYSRIQNIRNNSEKISDFRNILPENLAKYLLKLHSLKNNFIHGNIHPSNFYITKQGKIGIFDLVSYSQGFVESDISRIFVNSNYDIKYFFNFLNLYGIEKINLDRLYNSIYKDIYENYVVGLNDSIYNYNIINDFKENKTKLLSLKKLLQIKLSFKSDN